MGQSAGSVSADEYAQLTGMIVHSNADKPVAGAELSGSGSGFVRPAPSDVFATHHAAHNAQQTGAKHG